MYNGYRVFPGGKERPGRDDDHSPFYCRGQETVELYFYPPMGRTACTEPQCLHSIAIPLIPYVQYGLYRASVPVQYSYTSTPPMDRTACTEPQ